MASNVCFALHYFFPTACFCFALSHLRSLSHHRALEIGSGSGYVITSLTLILQRLHPNQAHLLLATDINPAAAAATHSTLQSHSLSPHVDIIITDLVSTLVPRLNHAIDLLLFNPPYVPTPDEEVERGGIAAAWAGGYKGRKVIDRVLPLVDGLVSKQGGHMLMVIVPDNDPQGTLHQYLCLCIALYVYNTSQNNKT